MRIWFYRNICAILIAFIINQLQTNAQSNLILNNNVAKRIVDQEIAEIYGIDFLKANLLFDDHKSGAFYIWSYQMRNKTYYLDSWDKNWNDSIHTQPRCYAIYYHITFDNKIICSDCLVAYLDSMGNFFRSELSIGFLEIESNGKGALLHKKKDFFKAAKELGYVDDGSDDYEIPRKFEIQWYRKKKLNRLVWIVRQYKKTVTEGMKSTLYYDEWLFDPWTVEFIEKRTEIGVEFWACHFGKSSKKDKKQK